MTWASRSISMTATRTGMFLRKQLWIWPIVAVVMLSMIGYFVRGAIESTIKANVSSGLQTLLNLETGMLEKWFEVQESAAEALANDASVRKTVYALLDSESVEASNQSESELDLHKILARELAPSMSAHDFVGYMLVDKSMSVVSSSHTALTGERQVTEYAEFLERALHGESFVSPPFPSVVMMKGVDGRPWIGVPTMYACAPIRDASFQVVAVLALQIRPEREFTPILQLGQVGAAGETYAFNKEGIMISNSRFDEELILLGLLPDRTDSQSILQMSIRDPGVDMTQGHRPNLRRSEMPLTIMAADAIAGNAGMNVEGYRDYRGVSVIGAWRWLPKYEIGVAIEVETAQAFRPLMILQRTFLIIYGLLILSAIAIFVFTLVVARLQRQSREAVIEAQQLGQYTLDEKLGEGAMGVVYRGHHSMLRRPTAIKLLHTNKVNDASIARFEREVQITCQLNHANTIAIYDYGRTPEGVFYYAMEYLDGIDLQNLVGKYGPQSEARVIQILLQMCGSLFEAHSQGLVHRDIKPANIMLNRRGCEPDVVKVLDFGLVKAVDQTDGENKAQQGSMSGTPLYMSPESIQAPMTVDARSDIYAVGAVGYFLLTGRSVFEANGIVELCQKHIDESPVAPSKRANIQVSGQLEDAIMSCLEKSRAKRPQTARDLSVLISKCETTSRWTIEDADRWWGRHERGSQTSTPNPSAVNPAVAMEVTMDQTMDQTMDPETAEKKTAE
ncbi:Serine/threonine-protein kinase PknB [Novipirellula aureliae]|uniref:Serine/threonine-protein kinase PknB n=2 Tax=Novipirellula aureliae TaxID=2527966 RepID=A0A5C6E5H2_9BACT|nr:Serine/threonine-protein kinase PknB [Novipirellula aureliae]